MEAAEASRGEDTAADMVGVAEEATTDLHLQSCTPAYIINVIETIVYATQFEILFISVLKEELRKVKKKTCVAI